MRSKRKPKDLSRREFIATSAVVAATATGAAVGSAALLGLEGAALGTPDYMSPEQARGDVDIDFRTDVWSVCVVLYEMISGALPFSADTVSGMLVSVVMDSPALLTDAPYELARLVHRCLEKDPKKRPADVAELAKALAPFAGKPGEAQAHGAKHRLYGS